MIWGTSRQATPAAIRANVAMIEEFRFIEAVVPDFTHTMTEQVSAPVVVSKLMMDR